MKLNRDSLFVYLSAVLGARFVSGLRSADDYSVAYICMLVYHCIKYSPDGCLPDPPLMDDLTDSDSL